MTRGAEPDQDPPPPPGRIPEAWRTVLVALDHLDDGLSIVDADLRMVAWNTRFLELLEMPRERFDRPDVRFEDFIRFNAERGEYGPGNVDDLVRVRVERARRFEPHCFERVRPDGTVIEVRGNPLPGGGFVTIYKDITQRRADERALKESNDLLESRVAQRTAELSALNERLLAETAERLRAIEELRENREWIRLFADTVPAVIGYVDSEQRYRFANRGYEQWFGLTEAEIVGRTVHEVLGAEMHRGHAPHMKAALAGERSTREFSMRMADGSQTRVVASFIPHVDEQGQVQGYFVLGQDVTDQRQAEAVLRQAQKMEAIGQLTGGLAHDFNNLLTIIIGNLAVLREQTDENAAAMVDPALDAARRGAALVKRLLAFARRQPLQPKHMDAGEAVRGMAELFARTLGAHIRFDIETGGATQCVRADPHQFENALLNLVINARDAMPDGGRLAIRLARRRLGPETAGRHPDLRPGTYVAVSVSDSGTGMAPEVIERAFEPFFSTKGKGSGSGLGLAMVYGFAHQSGGHVEIASRQGHGTTVTLLLPLAAGPAEPRADAAEPRRAPGGSERVLIVEDEDQVRAFAAKALRDLGYRVAEAADGQAALAVLDLARPPELVVSDVEMPGEMDGIDLAVEIRRRVPGVRVLFMSGYPDRVLEKGKPMEGDAPLLAKPFEKVDLALRVREALAAR